MSDFSKQRTMMVDTQVRPSDVTKFPIIDAMLNVARERFVPEAAKNTAYMDGPIPFAAGRTMLEPRVLAKMLDAVNVQPNEMVLDLGVGLGYSSALLSRLAEAVVALEEDEDLAKEAETTLAEVEADNVAVIQGTLSEGAAKHGPFDVLIVEGAVAELPQSLIDQVKEGGRIAAIFQTGALGVCRIGFKRAQSVDWRDVFNASADILPGFAKVEEFQL